MLNPHVDFYNYSPTQRLIEDNLIEVVKTYGLDAYYLPRNVQNMDHIFGEDPTSIFDKAVRCEFFPKNNDAYQGDGEFLSKFGVEVRHGMSVSIPIRRWEQIRTEKLIQENNYNLLTEDSSSLIPVVVNNLKLEAGNIDNYTITSEQPLAGDLIYFPIFQEIYEIKYVKNEEFFYPLGKLLVYDLTVELFDYSQERFTTQVSEINSDIDPFKNLFNEFELKTEDQDTITQENGGFIGNEDYTPEVNDSHANNVLFTNESEKIVDFSEFSPFVKVNDNKRY